MFTASTKRGLENVSELCHLLHIYLLLNTIMSQSKPVTVGQCYTVAEIASLLHVHQMTVRSWYRENNLKIQRVGRKGVRIAASDLQNFLDQMQQESVAHCQHDSGSTATTRQSGNRKNDEHNRKEEL